MGGLRLRRGWLASFISDPEVPAIFQEVGMDGRAKAAEFLRQHDA